MANRIHVAGEYRSVEYEAYASGIYPGMLVAVNSSGEIAVHATEGGRHEKLFVEEQALRGKTVDDVTTSGDKVVCILGLPGTEIYALLEDGQNVSIGTELISAGNGKLKAASDLESGETLAQVVAISLEAEDLTGSSTSDTLIKVRLVA